MTTREPARIDVGDLAEAVLVSVRRALEEREDPGVLVPPVFRNPRFICGFILDPAEGGPTPVNTTQQ